MDTLSGTLPYKQVLIDKLYKLLQKTQNTIKLQEVLDEMGDIADPDFILPLYTAYKTLRDSRHLNTISHYPLSALSNINHHDVVPIAISIMDDSKTTDTDLSYAIKILDSLKVYKLEIAKKVFLYFKKIVSRARKQKNPERIWIEFGTMSRYLANAKFEESFNYFLRVFLDNFWSKHTRENALKVAMIINSSKCTKVIEGKYNNLNLGTRLIIAKIIKNRSDERTETLKQKIMKKGSVRERQILEESLPRIQTKGRSISQWLLDVLLDIVDIRNEINFKTGSLYEFPLFLETEYLFFDSITAIDTEEELVNKTSSLRTIVGRLNKEHLKQHGLSNEKIEELLPSSIKRDYNKPLNLLFLYLKSRDISVAPNLWGLRDLHSLLSFISAHKEAKSKLLKSLKKLNLSKLYSKQRWEELFNEILKLYLKWLRTLSENLPES